MCVLLRDSAKLVRSGILLWSVRLSIGLVLGKFGLCICMERACVRRRNSEHGSELAAIMPDSDLVVVHAWF